MRHVESIGIVAVVIFLHACRDGGRFRPHGADESRPNQNCVMKGQTAEGIQEEDAPESLGR